MRKFLTLLGVVAVPVLAQAQSPRLVLLEHFTQASCGPCATYNPALNNILNNNPQMIVAIKYQVNWPGFDPMNLHNPTEVQSRRTYYNVNAVPNAVIDGNQYNGNPASVSTSNFSTRASVPSPFTVKVTQSFSAGGDSVYVRTVVKKTANTTAGASLKVHMAVVERNIHFPTPPGSNGETHFESVMKKMLPNANGTALPALNVGDSAVFTGAWKMANVYSVGEIASVGFVQDNGTKEVLQAGFAAPNFPLSMQLDAVNGTSASIAGNSATRSFDVDLYTVNQYADTYRVTLDKSELPVGWDASFSYNGTTYTDFADIPLWANGIANLDVQIITGSNSNEKGKVKLKVNSNNLYPNYSITRELTAFSHITTGFINKKASAAATFSNSFNAAGSPFVTITESEFQNFDIASLTTANVDHLFLNTSDNYSSALLTDREVFALRSYLDSGGQLFIAGQDVGYSAFAGGGSQDFKNFYKNYLGANYVSDGNNAALALNVPATDAIFSSIAPSTLNSLATYSDHLSVNTTQMGARPIIMYGNSTTDVAATRNSDQQWKTVYLGFRFEAISSATFRNELVDLAIDWFNSNVTGEEFDAALSAAMLKTYPNPTSNVLNVELNEVPAAATLNVYDVLGRVVLTEQVPAGTSTFQLNTSSLDAGTYSYRLEGAVNTTASKLVVVR